MKIRKDVLSLEQYLKMINTETIRTDQECQRLAEQWTPEIVNELIYTVLTNNYIPPIILGEEIVNGITKQWIIDGLQRSSSLFMFRYGNKKITKKLDVSVVSYQRKVTNENGQVVRDSNNEIVWEIVEFDIANKTYDQLPEELKDIFGQYQLDTVIHQNCDTTEISKLVKRYNNCVPMTQSQRAFTYIDAFASEIREITNNSVFFNEVFNCTAKNRKNGSCERLVGDMVMLCYYPDNYKKDSKKGFKWLNENATMLDFKNLDDLLNRIVKIVGDNEEVAELFNSKNAHVLTAIINQNNTLTDEQMRGFFEWFVADGKNAIIDNDTWTEIDVIRSTRDVSVINGKISYINQVLNQYLKENSQVA